MTVRKIIDKQLDALLSNVWKWALTEMSMPTISAGESDLISRMALLTVNWELRAREAIAELSASDREMFDICRATCKAVMEADLDALQVATERMYEFGSKDANEQERQRLREICDHAVSTAREKFQEQ